jgi:hypothetical protein
MNDTSSPIFDVEGEKLKLELNKLELEKEKLKLEEAKLQLERQKAKWAALSVTVPLLAAILTVAYGIWSVHQQSRSQFEIKAAEIVMGSNGPGEALGRARAFVALFPDRLPPNFASSFDPKQFGSRNKSTFEAKKEFLHMLTEKSTKPQEIVDMWRQLFPNDEWLKNFQVHEDKDTQVRTGRP